MKHDLVRLARSAIALSIAIFLPLVGASMRVYPGGTSWDHASVGHDFWLNYLCDLLRPTALDGVPNPCGSALAKTATLVLGAGLLAFFWLVPNHFPSLPRLGRAVRVLGTLSVAGVPGVVFVSGDRYGVLHGLSVVVAATPGLLAALLAVVGLVRGEAGPKRAAMIGVATLAVSAIDFALYIPQILDDAPGPIAVAILERVSLGMMLVWMCVVARSRANQLA
jgi:hypothetical protein